jgi:hypothetical protein
VSRIGCGRQATYRLSEGRWTARQAEGGLHGEKLRERFGDKPANGLLIKLKRLIGIRKKPEIFLSSYIAQRFGITRRKTFLME